MASQDQKKRTLEALERRYALAKADIQLKEQREKKQKFEHDRPAKNDKGSFTPPATAFRTPSTAPQSNFSLKKVTDVEADGPAYLPLSHSVHEKLVAASEVSSKGKSKVDKILHDLLQSGDSAQKYLQGSRSMKVDNWILLDNFVPPNSASSFTLKASQGCSNSKRSKKHMSMKQLKKHGSFDLAKEFHRFDIFMPMHEMWKSYVLQLLKKTGKNQVAQCLFGADLHGAILRVVECKRDGLVGVTGIMIRETADTFGLITQGDKFKVVPKKASFFLLQADCWKITLCGDKLISRNLPS